MMKLLYAANWKMYLSATQEISYFEQYKKDFEELVNSGTIAIFPSFISLPIIALKTKNSSLSVGAQDCSFATDGAYTGQISASTLAELNCMYCIVGHSEQRALGLTNEQIVQKILRLYESTITPILCVGETQQEYAHGSQEQAIKRQLEPIITAIKNNKVFDLVIAYEPVWAIGTNTTPTNAQIEQIFNLITSMMQSSPVRLRVLYGGSVTQQTVHQLKGIPGLGGFLIGHASINFQEFKK